MDISQDVKCLKGVGPKLLEKLKFQLGLEYWLLLHK